jgi:CelD/BcsL family acetyltransferase involved in cellulose biosynthesis
VKQFDRPSDLQAIVTATDMVSEKTYQRGFAPAWASDEMSKRLSLWLRRGAYSAYIIYLNEKACAYQHVLKYRGRAFAVGTGFDPAFREYGVGRYVQLRAMERVFDEAAAITELDFGFGDAQYKRELCRTHDDEADLLLFAPRPRALAANAIRTLELAAVRLVKESLRYAGQFSRVKARWRNHRCNASKSNRTTP